MEHGLYPATSKTFSRKPELHFYLPPKVVPCFRADLCQIWSRGKTVYSVYYKHIKVRKKMRSAIPWVTISWYILEHLLRTQCCYTDVPKLSIWSILFSCWSYTFSKKSTVLVTFIFTNIITKKTYITKQSSFLPIFSILLKLLRLEGGYSALTLANWFYRDHLKKKILH